MSKTKWFIYTVLLGLLPILARLLIALLSKHSVSPLESSDLVGFGLVLTITNINSLEHATHVPADWKTQTIGISLVAVALLSIVFAASCLGDDQVDRRMTLYSAMALVFAAFAHSYSVFERISATEAGI
ncbi:MAG: hypothetical protein B6A08_20630 [Sorangiineae bacterium NIC37A_2]|nr:MAG: hypothetical protein B6A08_20630 [Sorangiineae bacterium NIC37A_2]